MSDKDFMEILEDLKKVVESIAEEQGNMKAEQKTQGRLLRDMDICLRGTGYVNTNGGLVAKVDKNTDKVEKIERRQSKIIAWGASIVGLINLGGIVTVILTALRKS